PRPRNSAAALTIPERLLRSSGSPLKVPWCGRVPPYLMRYATPPNATSAEDTRTPAWSSAPTRSSTSSSDTAGGTTGDHLHRERGDHEGIDDSKDLLPGARQNPNSEGRTGEDTEHHGHRDARIDVAPGQIDAGARRRRHPDHEVARRGRHLERQAHRL